jgi:hypothetical protein
MRLAAEQPWNDIEIGDISREAGVSLAEFRECYPSSTCLSIIRAKPPSTAPFEG